MKIKEEIILSKNLFNNFDAIIENGFLQTVNLLSCHCNFGKFIFPNVNRIATLTSVPLKYSYPITITLKNFRFVNNVNIEFQSLISKKKITIQRENLLKYFNEFFKQNDYNPAINVEEMLLKNFKCIEYFPKFKIDYLYKDHKYEIIVRINNDDELLGIYNSKYILEKNNSKYILEKNYHYLTLSFNDKIFNTLEEIRDYIQSFENLIDFIKEEKICSCEKCIIMKNLNNHRKKEQKQIMHELHNELNLGFHNIKYYQVLLQLKKDYNKTINKTICDDNENEIEKVEKVEKIIDFTIKHKKEFSTIFKSYIHLLKTLSLETFLDFFDSHIQEIDKEFLQLLKSLKSLNSNENFDFAIEILLQ